MNFKNKKLLYILCPLLAFVAWGLNSSFRMSAPLDSFRNGMRSPASTEFTFEALHPQKDKQTLLEIQDAFEEEREKGDFDQKPLKLFQAWRSGETFLVLLRASPDIEDPMHMEEVFAYNYDPRSGDKDMITYLYGKDQITRESWFGWKFLKLTNFEEGMAPDITFQFVSCRECKAQVFLSSFQYDSAFEKWKIREWGHKSHLFIDSDLALEEGVPRFQCYWRIGDFNQDTLEDLYARCTERDALTKKLSTVFNRLYSIKEMVVSLEEKDDTFFERFKAKLHVGRVDERSSFQIR